MQEADVGTGPVVGWTDAEIAALPGWSLIQASQVMARRFHATLRAVGLSPTEFGVLAQLEANPQLSHAQLARRVRMTPQSMGEQVRGLVSRGLVRRQDGVTRGRRIDIFLTEDGQELLSRATPLIRRLNEPASLGLTPDQAAELNALLHAVQDAANPAD